MSNSRPVSPKPLSGKLHFNMNVEIFHIFNSNERIDHLTSRKQIQNMVNSINIIALSPYGALKQKLSTLDWTLNE